MKHSIEWQDDAVNAAPEERATVADLRLFLNDRNMTQHMLEGQAGDHVTVALYGLAEGLAHDWWTIFGSRDRSFSLRRYRNGFLLPDIRMQFDGATFEIAAHESAYADPDLRFFGGAAESLTRSQGEAWLSSLIGDVLERLRERGLTDSGAAIRWGRVLASFENGEAGFCEAAGGLGLDPYDIADTPADFLENAERIFSGEALVEFVAGAREGEPSRLLDWTSRMLRTVDARYRLPDLRPIVDGVGSDTPWRGGEPAYALGYRRARAVRLALGLSPVLRLPSFRDVADRFGATPAYSIAPKVDGISALRREGIGGIHVHVRNHGETSAANSLHLFALARAVGDAACFPEAAVAPINHLRHAYRQAAGRAFAAEFLAPIEEIRSMREDERDVDSIAGEFGVSPQVIEHQLENGRRIDQACV